MIKFELGIKASANQAKQFFLLNGCEINQWAMNSEWHLYWDTITIVLECLEFVLEIMVVLSLILLPQILLEYDKYGKAPEFCNLKALICFRLHSG